MPSNVGSQTLHVKFFDSVTNPNTNFIGLDVRKVGIYTGGYLTVVNNTTASLSTFSCEIADSSATGNQIRCATGTAVNVTVGVLAPLVVLRWTYTGSAANDYVDFKAVAVGAQLSTDVVVGLCVFAGSTLTGFTYALRTNPNVQDLFLKVEPTVPASMYVRVRGGRACYGTANYDIVDQPSPLLVAPGSNSRIGVVQVTAAGAISVTYGSSSATPTPPDYGSLITLAEITISAGQTTITSSSIKDVRSFVGFSTGAIDPTYLVPTGAIIMWSGSIATIPTGWQLCNGTAGTPDLRDRFIIGAKQDSGGVAKTNVTGSLTQTGGEVTHTLTTAEMPAHTHTYSEAAISSDRGPEAHTSLRGLITDNTGSTGGGAAHNTLPVYYALAYIMKL